MGWCSATYIFDATMHAVNDVLDDIMEQYSDHLPKHEMFLRVARPLVKKLEDGDWDCQQESDFYDKYKWDLWPDVEQNLINDLKEYAEPGDEYEDREGILHRYSEEKQAFYHPLDIKCNDPDCLDYRGRK